MEVKRGKCLCGDPEVVVEENGKQVMYRCPLYVKMTGENPQDGEKIEEWDCSIAWLPFIGLEFIKAMKEGSKSVYEVTESFRNEIVGRIENAQLSRQPRMTIIEAPDGEE